MKAVGNFGGSLASITSKEKKNIKSIAKSGWVFFGIHFLSVFLISDRITNLSPISQIISVKEKVKDKTKKNSSSLKLVRRTIIINFTIKMTMIRKTFLSGHMRSISMSMLKVLHIKSPNLMTKSRKS